MNKNISSTASNKDDINNLKQTLKYEREKKDKIIHNILDIMKGNFAVIATHRYPLLDESEELGVENSKQRKQMIEESDLFLNLRNSNILELRVDYILNDKLSGEEMFLIPGICFGEALNIGITQRQRTIIYKDEKSCREIWTGRADHIGMEGINPIVHPGEVLRYYNNDLSDLKEVVKMLVDKTKSSEMFVDKYGRRVTDVRVGVKELVKPFFVDPFYSIQDIYRFKDGFEVSNINRNSFTNIR